MVVFKSVLLCLLVFCIMGTCGKPAYDEQAMAPGVWSRLWGWVSYLNPWGSAVDTSAAPPTPVLLINSTEIKNPPVVEARQFTAITIPGNSTAALKSSSDESVENEDPITPIISVQNVHISTTTEEHSLEAKASSTVLTSDQTNAITLRKSAIDSREPKTLITPIESVQSYPTETEELVLEHHTEPSLSTTLIDQDISPTSEKPAIYEPEEPKLSTTSIVLDLINTITTGELVTEQRLELEVSTMGQNKPLTSEVITISFIPDIEEPIESETSIYVSTLDTPIVSEGPVTDYPPESEASTTTIAINQNILTSREKPVTEQIFEPEVTIISIALDTPKTAVEPLELLTSIYVSALDTPTVTEDRKSTTEHLSESKLSTTSIASDLDFPTSTNEPAMEQVFEFESPTTVSALNNPTTEEPAADDSLVPEMTITDQRDQNNTTITKETATEKGELPLKMEVFTNRISTREDGALFSGLLYESLVPTEPAVVESKKDEESIKRSKPVSIKDEKSTDRSDGSILHEFLTDPYPDVAVAVSERDKESTERSVASILSEPTIGQFSGGAAAVTETDEESIRRSDTLILSEFTSDPYLDVAVTVSGKNEESTERSESSILTETVKDLNLNVVLGRDEISTKESKASILTETATNLYKQVLEVSVSTNPIQFLEVEKVVPTGVNEVSMNVNAAFTAVKKVEAMFTEQNELAAPRVSRSHSSGYRLSFDHLRFMFLFYTVYFMKA